MPPKEDANPPDASKKPDGEELDNEELDNDELDNEELDNEELDNEEEVDNTGLFVHLLFFVVGGKEDKRQAFMMSVPKADLKVKSLEYLKTQISKKDHEKEYAYLSFCSEGGAVVDENWNIQVYLDIVGGSDDDEKSKPAAKHKTYSVYLKQRYDRTVLDETRIPKVKLELPKDASYLKAGELKELTSTLNLINWKAAKDTQTSKGPAELLQEDWRLVALNNPFCYGLSIIRLKEGETTIPIGMKRARYPAFRIKPRKVGISEPNPYVRVPDYIVDDQSYVTICETKNHFENSLSESAITTWDILYSAAMSFAGVQVGSSAGYKHSVAKQKTKLTKGDTARMNISYNFPRATLILDQHSLELTPQCEEDLKKVQDEKSMIKFSELYGEYFSQEIQLGGRLYASEDFKWEGESSSNEVKWSLTVQAASSLKGEIKGVGFSGGPEVGAGHSQGEGKGEVKSTMRNALQWQANGGDALLCNNPPEWCPTVASHLNWRIINRAENCQLVDLLAEFPGQDRLKRFIKHADYSHLNRALHPETGRIFYLRNGSLFQYLTFYQWKSIPDPIRKILPNASPYYATAIMSSQVEDCNLYGCYFEFHTLQGIPAAKVEYEKPYILRNPSTDLYLGHYDNGFKYYWLVSREHPPESPWAVYLRASDGTKSGEVQQGDSVNLRLRASKGEDACIVTQGEWEGNYGFLHATKGRKEVTEKVFQLLYKDMEPPPKST